MKTAEISEETAWRTAGFSRDAAARQKYQGTELTHMGFSAYHCFTARKETELSFIISSVEDYGMTIKYFRSIV